MIELINQPYTIVCEYLNNCVYWKETLCVRCNEKLSVTEDYPFVVKGFYNDIYHVKCIKNTIFMNT